MAFVLPMIAAGATALSGAGAAIGGMFAGAGAAAGGASLGGGLAASAAGGVSAAAAAGSSLSLGALSTGLSTVGGLFSAVGTYQQGMFQSKIATYNAQLADQNKNAALGAGQNAEQLKRLQTGKEVGSEAAAQAAGGTDVGGGSNVQVRQATQTAGDFDALNIRYNAARQAYGYSQEAFSDMLQAKSAKQSAVSGLVGGIFKAGSSFISGASSLTDKWLQYQMSGALQVPTGGNG